MAYSSSPVSASATDRLRPLDGIRGVAILLVLAWHFIPCMKPEDASYPLRLLCQIVGMSRGGVDIFFVLSGFLITGILLDHPSTPETRRAFYIRRACRIFPLYFLLLGTFALARTLPLATHPDYQWMFENPIPLGWYAAFLQNYPMGVQEHVGPHWLGITWSLAVEEQFYLLIPWVVWLAPRRFFLAIVIAGIAFAPLLRAATPSMLSFLGTPWRADSLLFGSLVALLVRQPSFLVVVRRHTVSLIILLGILILGALVMSFRPREFAVFNHSWLALLGGTLILLVLVAPRLWLLAPLRQGPLTWLGTRSYAIYLFHEPLNGLFHGSMLHSRPLLSSPYAALATGLALLTTCLLAEISYRWLERPIIAWGRRHRYTPAPHGTLVDHLQAANKTHETGTNTASAPQAVVPSL